MAEKIGVCDYSYNEDKQQLRVNCLGCLFGASIEDFEECMARTIDKILEVRKVHSIVLAKEREYEYGPEQTAMLREIADIIERVIRERLISIDKLGGEGCRKIAEAFSGKLQYIVLDLMRKDPIGAYVELSREIRHLKSKMKELTKREHVQCAQKILREVLEPLKERMEQTRIIQFARPHAAGYHIGDRALYRELFMPSVRPNFMLTRYVMTPPEGGKSVDRYDVGDIQVEVYKMPNSTEYFYHILPPEFRLPQEQYTILDAARRYMATHRPKTAEFVKSKRVREVFANIGKDMIREVSKQMDVELSTKELELLASILTRYTAGLGVLEVLLADEKVQDIYINSPIERQPILINHQEWEECRTNLIPTMEDAEAWATRLRIHSGRPLDEANPVLDTEVTVPGGKARFALITRTLSPHGLGFAIRRHRDKPWTLPLFIKAKTITPLAAGLLSFLIDGTVSMLVAGGRGAGKTSMLGSLMLEILPKTRVLTIEDSVTGDSEILYQRNGRIERDTIGNLIDRQVKRYGKCMLGRDIVEGNPDSIRVYSFDGKGKVSLSNVSRFIRHRTKKDIYEVVTRTGRRLKVTGDHSLFTMGEGSIMKPVECRKLREGDFIVTPRALRSRNNRIIEINLMEHLDKLEGSFISGHGLREFIERNRVAIGRVARKHGYMVVGPMRGTICSWRRNRILPSKVAGELAREGLEFPEGMELKYMTGSGRIGSRIELEDDFLRFVGLWIADGCYDRNSVIISVSEEEARDVVRRVAERFGLKAKMHSDGFSLMINSKPLKEVMRRVLGLIGDAHTKRVPQWVFGLSDSQVGNVLNGIFSGDGCVSDKEILMSVRSGDLTRDVQTLLLGLGIITRVSERAGFHHCRISSLSSMDSFRKGVGLLTRKKAERFESLCRKSSTHDSSDFIPLNHEMRIGMNNHSKLFSFTDYIARQNNVGRAHLGNLASSHEFEDYEGIEQVRMLAESDIFWDSVKSVSKIETADDYVYDISVPGRENFVCGNILAHNTLELPVDQLRDMGYNIESLKSRSVITMVETEMPADEALRTALRLGDSALIVGEVRSTEAKALYEAMRIGALSNVVAGTIHGESAYGVYDRVVNDLGVPKTSFKATDILPICKSLRSADGLHRFRRMTEITEIRKAWEQDPVKEGGFVNLMEYSGKKDMLQPTDTFKNGESEVLNRIASYIKEYSGNWDAVWENILLRSKMKEAHVKLADKLGNPEIMEADWTIKSNNMFHLISELVKREKGFPEPSEIYTRWEAWLKKELRG